MTLYFLCNKIQNQVKCNVISDALFKSQIAVTLT
jgi:hypothetical protein